MYTKKPVVTSKLFILYAIAFLLILNHAYVFASEKPESYVIVYDRLYDYGTDTSDVLQQYAELKSAGQDVLLFQADQLETEKIEENSIIIVAPSSFDSIEKYNRVLSGFNGFQVRILQDQLISAEDSLEKPGFMMAIDKVYPFSDFNQLMDMAEELNDKGIEFIVTFMPVYDNYELEAFDTYVKVLQYVGKMGGKLFIHYPVEHTDVRYDSDPRVGFEKAVAEFRKHNLNIAGIALPQDKMLANIRVFEGLNLPFILTTEAEGKIDPEIDLLKASQILNDYIMIQGIYIDQFDYFRYREENQPRGQQAVYISLNEEKEKLFDLLKIFSAEQISVKDFNVRDYMDKLRLTEYIQTASTDPSEGKTEYERFLEEEMKKIMGENVEQEKLMEGYDISGLAGIALRIAFIIFSLLVIQILIGRHFERKKYFKN